MSLANIDSRTDTRTDTRTDARALRQLGPVDVLDTALSLVRAAPWLQLTRAWSAGFPLASCAVAVYYLERVEGMQGLRPVLALSLVLAYLWRSLVLGQVARGFALSLRPSLPMPADAGKVVDVACTAAVFGLGLWLWSWPVAGLAKLSPFAVPLLVPVLALRGAIAPSWLARTRCASERGFGALGRSLDDTAGLRGMFALVELMLLCGALGLMINLYAFMAFALMLAGSLLGLEVAFISAFISPDNDVVLLALAAATFLLLEPLRAAVSGLVFAEARGRKDGADLHAAIDAVIAASQQKSSATGAASATGSDARAQAGRYGAVLACLLCVVLSGCASLARADAATPPPSATGAPAAVAADLGGASVPGAPAQAADDAVQSQVERILKRREFSEFAKSDTRSFWKWIQSYLERLFSRLPKDEERDNGSSWHISLPPISPWLVTTIALLVLVLVVLYVSVDARKPRGRAVAGQKPAATGSPAEQAPNVFLDEAAQLADRGQLREALRALYVATLAALDRARLIRFEPAKTNGQYLRGMPSGDVRKSFAAFTRVFDHKWYGHEPTSREDYERCRALADHICDVEPPV